jgi:ATP-dependent DNA helicase DinG
MPAAQEAEHRFAMGELPDEVMAICQRLAKLTEMLRGLAELFLNDLSEKPEATILCVCTGCCCK